MRDFSPLLKHELRLKLSNICSQEFASVEFLLNKYFVLRIFKIAFSGGAQTSSLTLVTRIQSFSTDTPCPLAILAMSHTSAGT